MLVTCSETASDSYSSGGGIAGLTTAIALTHFTKERHDIKIEIYEAAAQFTEIGAGIGFWTRPWKILKKLGCTDDLEKLLDNQLKEGELGTVSLFICLELALLIRDLLSVKSIELRKSDFKEGHTFYEVVTPSESTYICVEIFVNDIMTSALSS